MERSPLLEFSKVFRYETHYLEDIHDDLYFGYPVSPILEAERNLLRPESKPRAYFSMEFGLGTNVYHPFSSSRQIDPLNRLSENDIFSNQRVSDYLFTLKIDALLDLPIYSGGLGVLAGDTIKTAADCRLPLAAVGILWNKGYFKQRFWFKFGQLPEEMKWDPHTFPGLIPLEDIVILELKNRRIHLRLWKYYVYSCRLDHVVPLILLDSNLEVNEQNDRALTDQLYRSQDLDGRLLQRLILGMGGVKALEALGYPIDLHHLNEGHAAFAFVAKRRSDQGSSFDKLRSSFAYTCHTPVPAGHDRFSLEDVERILVEEDLNIVKQYGLESEAKNIVNLTVLALNTTRSVNAVSKKHADVMRLQFPEYAQRIKAVTNGVHFPTWVSDSVLDVLNKYKDHFEDVIADPTRLVRARELKQNEDFRKSLWEAHQENKTRLADLLRRWNLKKDVLTVAWARRIAAYKRPSLLLQDLERLRSIARTYGPLQILYAGKAHPNDNMAFTYINEIMGAIDKAVDKDGLLKIVMLENYDIYIAKLMTSGVDIWLNNPLPPYEASGTSGMKAIVNGVLQLTTLDGWVLEAQGAPIGRFFGFHDDGKAFSDHLVLRLQEDSQALYGALGSMAELYYATNKQGHLDVSSPWIDMMINCLVTAGYFNTNRMLQEYRTLVWES